MTWDENGGFCVATLLPGPVENLYVFQLYTNASPELHSIRSVVFAASLDGAVSMSPEQKINSTIQNKIFHVTQSCHA